MASVGGEEETGHLYALDFDGIICDSCGESSISALKAAKIRWPKVFLGIDSETEKWILDSMRIVRPVVETGYENLLLVRLLLESKFPNLRKTSVAEGMTVDAILEGWGRLKPVIMSDWSEPSSEDLVELFGTVRDDWIAHDLEGWIAANRLYPGTSDSLRFAASKIYIVTTKQARFAHLLLKELAGVDFPNEHIYGLGSGFVEDRLATLENVIKDPELNNWNLYLGTWGYNTASEREAAARNPRIHSLELPKFCEKLL